jgi:hypothetical protein
MSHMHWVLLSDAASLHGAVVAARTAHAQLTPLHPQSVLITVLLIMLFAI